MRRIAAAVLHLQEVADGVVDVALDVRAHGVAVAGMVAARRAASSLWEWGIGAPPFCPRCSRPVASISR